MKDFFKRNKNSIIRIGLISVILFLIIQVGMNVIPGMVHANDLFSEAESVVASSQEKIVHFAMAVAPLALIVVLLGFLFTHNEKKMAWLQQVAITILVVCALILIVNSGVVMDTLKDWFDLTGTT